MRNVISRLLCCWIALAAEAAAGSYVSVLAAPSIQRDGLEVCYTISAASKLSCRYLNISFYASRGAYASNVASAALMWAGTGQSYTGNGVHTLTFDTKVVLGVSLAELIENYSEGVVVVELTDSCDGVYGISASSIVGVSASIGYRPNAREPSVALRTFGSVDGRGIIREEFLSYSSPMEGFSSEVSSSLIYDKAQTLAGVIYDEAQNVSGVLSLNVGGLARNGMVKVKGTVTLLSGNKKMTVSKLMQVSDGCVVAGTLPFKNPVGPVEIEIEPDDTGALAFFAARDGWTVKAGAVGGKLTDVTRLAFSVQVGDMEFPSGFVVVTPSPQAVPIYVKGGTKWSFDRFPNIRYVRHKTDDGSVYELNGLDDANRPNVSALHLNYSEKTGLFSGTFRIYASNVGNVTGKPRLKVYTVKVKGIMLNNDRWSGGVQGRGVATVKIGKKSYVWPVGIVDDSDFALLKEFSDFAPLF